MQTNYLHLRALPRGHFSTDPRACILTRFRNSNGQLWAEGVAGTALYNMLLNGQVEYALVCRSATNDSA